MAEQGLNGVDLFWGLTAPGARMLPGLESVCVWNVETLDLSIQIFPLPGFFFYPPTGNRI